MVLALSSGVDMRRTLHGNTQCDSEFACGGDRQVADPAAAHVGRVGSVHAVAIDEQLRRVDRAADDDGATPSGASSIAEALQITGHLAAAPRADRYAAAAGAALAAATPILARLPRSGGHWLAVGEAAVRGPIQIAVACDPDRSDLLAAARTLAPGGAVVVGGAVNSSELLVDRDRVGGSDAAYVCRGRVCDLPVTTAGELAAALGGPV